MSIFLFSLILANGSSVGSDTERIADVSSSAFWFRCVLIAGFVVAIGCAMEVPETVAIYRRWKSARFKRVIIEGDPADWRIPVAAVGLLFVILGVTAEMIFELLTSDAETSVRQYDEASLASALKNAGDAKTSAGSAAVDALSAQASSIAISLRAEALEQEDKRLRSDVSMMHSRADLFKNPAVFTKLLAKLKPLAEQKVDVRFPAGIDKSEPQLTASALASIFQAAGMAVSGPMISSQSEVTGIIVYITWRASPKTRENALTLAHALIDVPLLLRSTRFEQASTRVIILPNPEPLGVMENVSREPQAFAEKPLLPFDDETIVVQIFPHP